ncbi:MAG: FAD binding domain-containing protein [Deltaproteobacteria bacterium]
MRLPPFEYRVPETLDEAVNIKGDQGASALILAGGTDLIVNLKHRLFSPATLISIRKIKEMNGIRVEPAALILGAGTSLADTAANPAVVEHFPILVKAIESIGAIGIQAFRGTIGGNLCLTPRCLLYNQSLFWRTGKGSCHRTGGKECHALEGSESCQSICSGDTVPVLLALSAMVTLAGPGGKRMVPLTEFFTGKGESPFNIAPEEILTEIRIPLPWAPLSWSYWRLGIRSAVDFPLVNAAAVAIQEKGKVEHFRLVLSGLGPAPVMLREAESVIKGTEPNADAVEKAGEIAFRAAEGIVVENASASREYRIKMARVMARRAVKEALGL